MNPSYTPFEAVHAIKCRVEGIFDDPILDRLGPLSANVLDDVARIVDSIPDYENDPAAILAIATSLRIRATIANLNTSSLYFGDDRFMCQCMRVAELFERWACTHVDFESLDEVWPYLLEDKFGAALVACHGVTMLSSLDDFNESHCAEVADELGLTLEAAPNLNN